jgi:lantibiotic biosynthesis protein
MSAGLDRDVLIDTAARIGAEIVATAVWKDSRCNWVGAMPEEVGDGRVTLAYRALGADLYGGSAGVGLFLAELSAITGDADFRRTALGALRHAMSHVEDPASSGHGLYAGRPGIALALTLAARALDEPALEEPARDMLTGPAIRPAGDELDLMTGNAGAVVGLLALRSLLGEDAALEIAVEHAGVLLASAQHTDTGLCWLSPNLPGTPGLTGYSHGAAGVAVALLELAAVTGETRYVEAADAGFAYERSLYDPVVENWPDLRRFGTVQPAEPSFASFWCHGAPGGALARLRAIELGRDGSLEAEAQAGLRTTRAWVEAGLGSRVNFSLCHGLAGNAEILLEATALVPEAEGLAYEVAAAGIDSYGRGRTPWPSGAHGGRTAGLFLGLAGIGRFYLRMAEPELESLLLIRPRG